MSSVCAVVAGPVEAFLVVLHRLRLLGGELEPLEQARGEARRAAHLLSRACSMGRAFVGRQRRPRPCRGHEAGPPTKGGGHRRAEARAPPASSRTLSATRWEWPCVRTVALVDDVAKVSSAAATSRRTPIRRQWSRSTGISTGTRAPRTRGSTRRRSPGPRRATPRLQRRGGLSRLPSPGRQRGSRASSRLKRPFRGPRARAGRRGATKPVEEPEECTRSRRRTPRAPTTEARTMLSRHGSPASRPWPRGSRPRPNEQCRPGPSTRAPAATIGAVTEEAVGDGLVGAEIVVSAMEDLGGDHNRREQRKRPTPQGARTYASGSASTSHPLNRGQGGFGEIPAEPPGRAARPRRRPQLNARMSSIRTLPASLSGNEHRTPAAGCSAKPSPGSAVESTSWLGRRFGSSRSAVSARSART